MKVLHINQLDTLREAGIAAYRLHQGLLGEGVDSFLLVGNRTTMCTSWHVRRQEKIQLLMGMLL
jgi:hypothetical protein